MIKLLAFFCILVPSSSFASNSIRIEIISPRDDTAYLDSEPVFFQARAFDSNNLEVAEVFSWHISDRFTGVQDVQSGAEFSLSLKPSIYDIEAKLISAQGELLGIAQVPFSVFHKPETTLLLSKKKLSGQWIWAKYASLIAWTRGAANVNVYQLEACAGGFTGSKPCRGWQQIGQGKSEGSMTVPYHQGDSFRVCASGTFPEDEGAEWKCSAAMRI